jgi:hypothetical protein
MDDDYKIDEYGKIVTEMNPHLLTGWIWEMFYSRPGPIEESLYPINMRDTRKDATAREGKE